MLIDKQFLIELLHTDDVVEDNVVENTRWSVIHEMVFELDGKFYETSYSVGSTEYQDESPFEYEPDQIECAEVHEVEKVMKAWEKV
jgi:hypothetical protein